MSDLERRLRDGRPPSPELGPELEERLLAAVMAGRRRRSPERWRRGFPRVGRGRLLGVAVLVLAGAGAAAIAAGILDHGSSAAARVGAPPQARWGAPALLGHSSELPRPKVAMSASGDAMVVWSAGGRKSSAAQKPTGQPVVVETPGLATTISTRGRRAGVTSTTSWCSPDALVIALAMVPSVVAAAVV